MHRFDLQTQAVPSDGPSMDWREKLLRLFADGALDRSRSLPERARVLAVLDQISADPNLVARLDVAERKELISEFQRLYHEQEPSPDEDS